MGGGGYELMFQHIYNMNNVEFRTGLIETQKMYH